MGGREGFLLIKIESSREQVQKELDPDGLNMIVCRRRFYQHRHRGREGKDPTLNNEPFIGIQHWNTGRMPSTEKTSIRFSEKLQEAITLLSFFGSLSTSLMQ